jgi:hypothetical protein
VTRRNYQRSDQSQRSEPVYRDHIIGPGGKIRPRGVFEDVFLFRRAKQPIELFLEESSIILEPLI